MKDIYAWLANHLPRRLLFAVVLRVACEYYAQREHGDREDIPRLIDWYAHQAWRRERAAQRRRFWRRAAYGLSILLCTAVYGLITFIILPHVAAVAFGWEAVAKAGTVLCFWPVFHDAMRQLWRMFTEGDQ